LLSVRSRTMCSSSTGFPTAEWDSGISSTRCSPVVDCRRARARVSDNVARAFANAVFAAEKASTRSLESGPCFASNSRSAAFSSTGRQSGDRADDNRRPENKWRSPTNSSAAQRRATRGARSHWWVDRLAARLRARRGRGSSSSRLEWGANRERERVAH